MARLTKQHFKAIAEIINKECYDENDERINYIFDFYGFIHRLGEYFKTQNPQFDEARFKEMCLK